MDKVLLLRKGFISRELEDDIVQNPFRLLSLPSDISKKDALNSDSIVSEVFMASLAEYGQQEIELKTRQFDILYSKRSDNGVCVIIFIREGIINNKDLGNLWNSNVIDPITRNIIPERETKKINKEFDFGCAFEHAELKTAICTIRRQQRYQQKLLDHRLLLKQKLNELEVQEEMKEEKEDLSIEDL
jgi:hypothetical protein